jgi:hypothetical protein
MCLPDPSPKGFFRSGDCRTSLGYVTDERGTKCPKCRSPMKDVVKCVRPDSGGSGHRLGFELFSWAGPQAEFRTLSLPGSLSSSRKDLLQFRFEVGVDGSRIDGRHHRKPRRSRRCAPAAKLRRSPRDAFFVSSPGGRGLSHLGPAPAVVSVSLVIYLFMRTATRNLCFARP